MSLELAIADACGPGKHRALTLCPTSRGWQASLQRPSGSAYAVHTAADPVEALWGVLGRDPSESLGAVREPVHDEEDLIG